MAPDRKIVTAEELDAMTPDERSASFEDSVVTDIDELPAAFRARVMATGRRLASEDQPTASE